MEDRPSGIIWVQFDHADVGQKTKHDNRHLYVPSIELTWTPIKPVTAVFRVGRNQGIQVFRKQFPLRPSAAKTIHGSQGDTETRVVVNFETRSTRQSFPHIHYVGLSRVTTTEGLYITGLCEHKIAVSSEVREHMKHLRTEGKLDLCISPIYNAEARAIKVCFLNARSLHKHIDDVRADLNFLNTDISIFQKHASAKSIATLSMKLVSTIYLEMIILLVITVALMVVLQYIVALIITLAIHCAVIEMG